MKEIGLQLYTIRDEFLKDEESIREGLKKVADMGYTQVEPAGMLIEPEKFAKYAKDAGVKIVNTHYDGNITLDNTEEAIRVHEILGTRYIGVGGFHPLDTPENVEKFIERLNRAGVILEREGYKFVYHNHSGEFIKMSNGKSTYEMLLEYMNPKFSALELDCYWAQNAGVDPASFITEHKDLIRLVHLKDMAVRKNPEGRIESYITELGHGNMNYKGIIAAADAAKVDYYIVEQDSNWMDGDCMKAAAFSCEYAHRNLM